MFRMCGYESEETANKSFGLFPAWDARSRLYGVRVHVEKERKTNRAERNFGVNVYISLRNWGGMC